MTFDIYSEHLLAHARNPRHYGTGSAESCCVSVFNEGCADTINLYMRTEGGIVVEVSFTGTLCALSTASASLCVEYIQGKTIEELRLVTPGVVYTLLGVPVTESRIRCALLCYQALQKKLTTCFPLKN